MAGTIPISMTQQFDVLGKPLSGGQLYIMVAGTVSTPQDAFQDLALLIKQPYPMTLDAAGRVPQFFLDNSVNATVKIRLQDKYGVVQLASDGVLIIGPAGGGGGTGGLSGDASQLFQTGDMKARYAIGVHPGATPGWVRANGLTIGNAVSGATMPEGARADCLALFVHLYGADTSLVVSGGRTGNASTDFANGKTIATPDYRGYALAALDDMGNTAAGRITSTYLSGSNPTMLGAAGGAQAIPLAVANIPSHTHSGTTGDDSPDHAHGYTVATASGFQKPAGTGTAPLDGTTSANTAGASARHKHPFATDGGAGLSATPTPVSVMQPTKLCTIYLKL